MASKWLFLVGCLVAGVLSAPSALAQETGITGDLERFASSSPQEKNEYASVTNAEIRASIKAIAKLVETARRENNVERLQCLNSRLVAIRSLLQVSEAAEVTMTEAMSMGEVERADHEFRKIAVARSKARALHAEAERCLEDSGAQPGDVDLIVTGPDVDTPDDLKEVPWEGDIDYDPPEASPFQ